MSITTRYFVRHEVVQVAPGRWALYRIRYTNLGGGNTTHLGHFPTRAAAKAAARGDT